MTDTVTASPGSAAAHRLAKLVTDVFAPGILVIAVLLAVGWHSTHSLRGVGWGLLAGLFCGVVPYAFIAVGVRRGRWTDRHLRVRRQRFVPFLVTMGSVASGNIALAVLGGPREVVALVTAMLTGLVVTLAVTSWWKISVHTAVAGGAVAILVLTYGTSLVMGAPLVALIGWSRVRLRVHSPAQTVVGALVGAAVAASVFTIHLNETYRLVMLEA
ncbi:phosphatase PAP2 family protein [Streptomyces gobiensis]|uniref:phosphatase PAP2 family protein n=1 Tax=Streptomyces gobiensis TaxID=2875706 RepID=UPI001E5C8E8C|nr:phosphatase PAP2 family protein [Streptomyces gobiensis]UGY92436.1 phosphatase PAP2 family protein [Streptomyces gobiensis]